jgi:hypothetical protein
MDFLLCNNPLAKMPAGRVAYLYHPGSPRIFASIIEIDYKKEVVDFNYKGNNVVFGYHRKDGIRRVFVLMTIHGGERDIDKSLAVLNRAAAWYCTCLIKEDIPVYGEGTWNLLQSYNVEQAPRLHVLQMKDTDQFLVSYGTGIFCTPDIKEVTGFINALYKDYDNYDDPDPISGVINKI